MEKKNNLSWLHVPNNCVISVNDILSMVLPAPVFPVCVYGPGHLYLPCVPPTRSVSRSGPDVHRRRISKPQKHTWMPVLDRSPRTRITSELSSGGYQHTV
jgi:hypothetical protein